MFEERVIRKVLSERMKIVRAVMKGTRPQGIDGILLASEIVAEQEGFLEKAEELAAASRRWMGQKGWEGRRRKQAMLLAQKAAKRAERNGSGSVQKTVVLIELLTKDTKIDLLQNIIASVKHLNPATIEIDDGEGIILSYRKKE